MGKKQIYELKPLFKERMQKLLSDSEDFEAYEKIIYRNPRNFIRVNTLKISVNDLKEKLEKKWKIVQPSKEHPEIMLVDQELGPGELGNAIEHVLGYYYIQEISSMLSAIALNPRPGDFVLDLASAPGSKTTQMAAMMENEGTIIANDLALGRIKILAANMERCGVSNTIITRNDGVSLCARLARSGFKFDKILLDAPCSGEGTLRSSAKAFTQWNIKAVESFSRLQKKLLAMSIKCLKVGGNLVYSTCTHSPEENESVVDFALRKFPVRVETLKMPIKCRPGITSWKGEEFNEDVTKTCRIYPQDNDSEGFFVAKLTLLDEVKGDTER